MEFKDTIYYKNLVSIATKALNHFDMDKLSATLDKTNNKYETTEV